MVRALGKLTRQDRRFAVFFLATCLLGVFTNYTRTSQNLAEWVKTAVAMVATVALLAWVGFFGWSVMRRHHAGDDLGFVVNNRRAAVLTVLTGVYVVLVCLRFPLASAFNPSLGLVLGAVLVEEILFRPLLIDLLRKALAGAGNPLRLAVVGSAVIWALVHIPSKPPLQVVGIFIGGLLFGALYAFSRSNIVGFVVHATANAGSTGGLLMFGLCLLLAPLTRRRRTSAVPGEMRPA